MRVEIREATRPGSPKPFETTGHITLDVEGRAYFDPGAEWVRDLHIVDSDAKPVTPQDGMRYLRSLPFNLRGSHCWAEIVEE